MYNGFNEFKLLFCARECTQESLIASLTGSVRAPESSNNSNGDVLRRSVEPVINVKSLFCDWKYLHITF